MRLDLPRKPNQLSSLGLQSSSGKSAMRSAEFNRVELLYLPRHSRLYNQHSPSAQSHGFVYSNICFYIPNSACNTSRVWLKLPNVISHDQMFATVLVSDFIGWAYIAICKMIGQGIVSLNRLSVGCVTTLRRQSGDSAGFWILSAWSKQ